MSLADDFLTSLNETYFNYRKACDWLVTSRLGRPVYQSQVYDLIINPLLQRGLVTRVGRGLYILQGSERASSNLKDDEFATYLRGKGVKP